MESDIFEKYNVRKVGNIKEKFKCITRVTFKALIIGTIVLEALNIPYFLESNKTSDYVEEHSIETIYDADDDYAISPYIYDENTEAYLKSDDLFSSDGGTLPVGQFDDNNYGLSHDIEGAENNHGCIFKDSRNSEGLSDDFTLIYGHNIVAPSGDRFLFSKLSQFADSDSYKATKTPQQMLDKTKGIDYYDEYGHYSLDIFASGVYDASDAYNWVGDFDDENDFQQKMNEIMSESDIKTDVVPHFGDKIVCLWTCPYRNSSDHKGNNRVLVFARARQLEKYKDLEVSKTL